MQKFWRFCGSLAVRSATSPHGHPDLHSRVVALDPAFAGAVVSMAAVDCMEPGHDRLWFRKVGRHRGVSLVSFIKGGSKMTKTVKHRRPIWGRLPVMLLLVVALVAAACGDDDGDTADTADTADSPSEVTQPQETAPDDDAPADTPEVESDPPSQDPPGDADTGDGGQAATGEAEPDDGDADPGETGDGGQTASGEPIRVGSLLDETGPLSIYGGPMADATRLAISDINASGGVLGRPLELVALDSKSDQNEYITGADRLVADDLAVVHAGITSASREAIRPTFTEAEILHFYNVLYEGGQCDRNLFVTGVTPTQQLQVLIPWAIENIGPRLYVLAADYNYGQISADWVQQYATDNGGEIVGEDFFPLDVAEFATTISDVQRAAPDAVVSLLVGGAHMSFYSQYAAAGVNSEIPIVSPTFGLGSEQVALDAESAENIIVAFPYFEELDTPANQEFVAAWQAEFGDDYPYITDLAVYTWEGWHLWADAVNAAGTLEREAVIAQLESGVSFDGPKGTVTFDGASHHLIQPVSLARTNDSNGFEVFETFDSVPPSWEQETCDLITNPEINEQFTPGGN